MLVLFQVVANKCLTIFTFTEISVSKKERNGK